MAGKKKISGWEKIQMNPAIKLCHKNLCQKNLCHKNGHKCVFSVDQKPKQIFRWEDQEIYYFSMALKEFGKNYDHISKIIQTKQVIFFGF